MLSPFCRPSTIPRLALLAVLIALPAEAQPSGAAPDTIEEAIAMVRNVADDDPVAQTRARARLAMQLVGQRIDVTNDVPGTCATLLTGTLEADRAVDEARRNEGEFANDPASAAWAARGGRCNEHAVLVARLLRGAGERVDLLTSTAGHTFPLVNYRPGYDPDNPWTWGPDALVADTWLENKWGSSGFITDPSVAWSEGYIFDDGDADVYSGATPNTTRALLRMFIQRGRAFIEARCDRYTELMASYVQYPEPVRASLGFRPPTDVCGLDAVRSPRIYGTSWRTRYGTMTFNRDGTGTYTTDQGRLRDLSLSGHTLTGVWIEKGSARKCASPIDGSSYWGRIAFTFDATFSSFSGVWSYCDGDLGGSWWGTLTSD